MLQLEYRTVQYEVSRYDLFSKASTRSLVLRVAKQNANLHKSDVKRPWNIGGLFAFLIFAT